MNFVEKKCDDTARRTIQFNIACRQWSGLQDSDVNEWLDNFSTYPCGEYYATRLLSQMLYYSEIDLEILLREGLYNRILGSKLIKDKQLAASFNLKTHEISRDISLMLKNILFIPLLDGIGPYESGNQITRILVQKLGIAAEQVVFHFNIDSMHQNNERLIIVDDCCGSGDQCSKFWNTAKVKDGRLLKQWCHDSQVRAHYITLVGYEDNVTRLSSQLTGLEICCVEQLNNEHRVFHDDSTFWQSSEERLEAQSFFAEVLKDYGIPLYGYSGMDFAVIMHRNIPDWSLPMFWRTSPGWKILMQRKNS